MVTDCPGSCSARHVGVRSASAIVRNAVRRHSAPGFWYPPGGFGAICTTLADDFVHRGGALLTATQVDSIEVDDECAQLRLRDGRSIVTRTVISTIPSANLVDMVSAPHRRGRPRIHGFEVWAKSTTSTWRRVIASIVVHNHVPSPMTAAIANDRKSSTERSAATAMTMTASGKHGDELAARPPPAVHRRREERRRGPSGGECHHEHRPSAGAASEQRSERDRQGEPADHPGSDAEVTVDDQADEATRSAEVVRCGPDHRELTGLGEVITRRVGGPAPEDHRVHDDIQAGRDCERDADRDSLRASIANAPAARATQGSRRRART